MKNSHLCPKCAQKRIWIIEKFRIPAEAAEGRELHVVPHQKDGKRAGLFEAMRTNPKGHFDLYLCDACGYSELWARDFRDLVADPASGATLVDTSKEKAGPFR